MHLFGLSVCIAPTSYSNDKHDQFAIPYLIQNTVVANPDSVFVIASREHSHTIGSRSFREPIDCIEEFRASTEFDLAQILFGGWVDKKLISHGISTAEVP
jgi:hypothetical protein